MQPISNSSSSSDKPIWYFLIFWTLLNAVQAYTLELHGDEAYYWVYSRFLAWGYFDHPPMVAIFIRIGDSIMHNELGLRLLTVLTNSASLYIIWLMLKRYSVKAKWFIPVVSSLFILHIYGFTTTPDSPLLFFAVLFYYFYQRYAERDDIKTAGILSLVTACMLYSKYHGILLIGFTVLSNSALLKRKSFWAIALAVLVLYVPHIYWQVTNDFPTLKYHLFTRSSDPYRFEFTYTYPLGQLLMAGPLIGWFLFYTGWKIKISDTFIRCLVFNCVGTFFFFLLTTLKGVVEIHWTLIAFVPLVMLVLISFSQLQQPPKWFYKVAYINVALILFIRLSLIFRVPFVIQNGHLESYFGFREWAQKVKAHIGSAYLMVPDGFQDPSKYNYYTNTTKAMAYDSRDYHKTQYDLWPIEDSLQHHKVYYITTAREHGLTEDSLVKRSWQQWYGGWINDARTYQKVEIAVLTKAVTAKEGDTVPLFLTIHNPYNYRVAFANSDNLNKVSLEACIVNGGDLVDVAQTVGGFNNLVLEPGATVKYNCAFKLSAKKGSYELYLSIHTTPLKGSKNSGTIKLDVQ
jgi:hypothetical protein